MRGASAQRRRQRQLKATSTIRVEVPRERVAPSPQSVTAAIFWLKNRDPENWRDRVEHTGAGGGAIQTVNRIEYVVVDPK